MKRLFTLQPNTHGKGSVVFAWHPQGAFLATCGSNRIVNVFNRQGEPHAEIPLEGSGKCLQLDWDQEGETLAILQSGSPVVKLWDANQGRESGLDTNQKDLTYVKWAVAAPMLAVGTQKGTLVLYDKRTLKKQSILGKHSKRIVSGMWNASNELSLASDDKQVTISDIGGQTLAQHSLKGEPSDLRVRTTDDPSMPSQILSTVVSGRALTVLDASDAEQLRTMAELTFPNSYGQIISYDWFTERLVCLGFDSGYVVAMRCEEAGTQEIFSTKLFPNGCSELAVSQHLMRAAACSGNMVKVVSLGTDDPADYKEVQDESMVLQTDGGNLEHLSWTKDGQILSVSSDEGALYNFLASLPVLAATHGTRYLYLTSLLELSLLDSVNPTTPPLLVKLQMEPTFVALGPSHVALGMNNHVLFHDLNVEGCPLSSEKEYLGTVEAIKLNAEYIAVLSEGRISLDTLADGDDGGGGVGGVVSRVFPESKEQKDITCLALTADFLIYGTKRGTITYVYLPELQSVSEYRHDSMVTALFPNQSGTRVAFLDGTNSGYLLSPVDDSLLAMPKLPPTATSFMWDHTDPNVLVGCGGQTFSVYAYTAHSVHGPTMNAIGVGLKYPTPSLSPILVNNGSVICQEPNGTITTIVLPTHEAIAHVDRKGGASPDKIRVCFQQSLALGRLSRAWEIAMLLRETELFIQLGKAAMNVLDIALATRAYRQMGDAGMVLALQDLEGIEDSHLLCGHLALIFDEHATAQDHFLQSTRPLAALEMRRDLLQWEQALKLAKTLAPDQVPTISREFAKQLEFRGQHEPALAMYHKGLGDASPFSGSTWDRDASHDRLCRAGIAKLSLRLGDVGRGVALALEGQDRECCRECGTILEALKQWSDAAKLYEVGEQLEKAAAIYIKTKAWGAVAPLMAKISAPKLHSEFAKAKEAEGSYQEAVTAYERASDRDSVVRLLLSSLERPSEAMSVIRETRSPQGALLVAQYCQSRDDPRGAIEFLVIAKRPAEAFEIAAKQEEMATFTAALGGSGTNEENQKVAQYYESKGDALKAGEFWFLCKENAKALRLFLQCGERAVEQAIDVVGRARSDMLTHQLIDFLMGETDGVPKDPNYIFRLYMALGNYPQAAKTAIIIARQEQELGNYRIAHGILFETHRELTAQRIRVPQELALNLMLLHSYVLVRPLTKIGDHLSGARMLIRVAKHISKFPMHVVPILTSTVIECHRAGLRAAAFEYASTLMRPEYRQQIGENYKRKIEAIVRKPGEKSDTEEPETPSPFDLNARVAETVLECPSTRNTIPYCIATGRHIVLNDLTTCPSCFFPALFSGFTALVEAEGMCPMCQQEVKPAELRRFDEEEARDWLVKASKQEDKKAATK